VNQQHKYVGTVNMHVNKGVNAINKTLKTTNSQSQTYKKSYKGQKRILNDLLTFTLLLAKSVSGLMKKT